jgi:hypothetical protein
VAVANKSTHNERRNYSSSVLADAVASKREDGTITAAVRILWSEDKPTAVTAVSLLQLQDQHSSPLVDRQQLARIHRVSLQLPWIRGKWQQSFTPFLLARQYRSCRLETAVLIDLHGQMHGIWLCTALGYITAFVDPLLSGVCPAEIAPLFQWPISGPAAKFWWVAPNSGWFNSSTKSFQVREPRCNYCLGQTLHPTAAGNWSVQRV